MMPLDMKDCKVRQNNKGNKFLFNILLVICVLFLFSPSSIIYASADIKISIYGNNVKSDVNPFIQDGRTLVPVRIIAENLGYKVDWKDKEQKVIISEGGNRLELSIGNKTAVRNGKKETLDVPPVIKNGRTFVPIRYIGEAFNQIVLWDNDSRSVHIMREREIPKNDGDYVGKYIMIDNADLSGMSSDKKKAEDIKIGDCGLVLKSEGELLYVDFIKPVGDLPEDWSFAKGYVPKRNCILNPNSTELGILSRICRLKNGEITATDSVSKSEYKTSGGRFANILKSEKDRVLIEMPGGAEDAWIFKKDIDFQLNDFKGNP